MRTNKEMVLMYMQDMTIKKGEDFKGFTTQELSADLNIQRTNLSAILNDCVKQGILEKSKQRPVLYRLKEGKKEEKHLSCFSKLIGVNGSLKNAVQLAKAAILYPGRRYEYIDRRRTGHWQNITDNHLVSVLQNL